MTAFMLFVVPTTPSSRKGGVANATLNANFSPQLSFAGRLYREARALSNGIYSADLPGNSKTEAG
jgi:hypothetical protein